MGSFVAWAFGALALAFGATAHDDLNVQAASPQLGLRRVVVLGRHGTRAPDPSIRKLCPAFAAEVLPKFGVAPAALSRVGMAETEEHGRFLRDRYSEFLPQGPYPYDGTYTFFSGRMERNIVSTQGVARGMFPLGTGLEGFEPASPQLVPIQTTQDGADVLLNCPRDGPCKNALKEDKAKWIAANEGRFYALNKDLLREVSLACGSELKPGGDKSVVANAKNIMDAFSFAKSEGLDYTMGGRLAPATLERFQKIITAHVNDMNFGKRHQLTYWVGDFIPELLKIARVPLLTPQNKFHLFLNHRELLYSVSHVLGMPVDFPGTPRDNFPPASSLIMEVYDDGVKLFFWSPTQPSAAAKGKYSAKGFPLRDLYHLGRVVPAAASGCAANQVCPIETLARSWLELVESTGTYVPICNVAKQDAFFARGEMSLSIVKKWVEPGQVGEEIPPDQEPEEEGDLDGPHWDASNLGSCAVSPLLSAPVLVGGAVVVAAAVGGLVGHSLGRRSHRVGAYSGWAEYVPAPF